MNILYYFEPWVELGRPYLRYHNLRYQLGPQIRALSYRSDVKIKIAIGEGTYHKCKSDGYDYEGCEVVVLFQDELRELSSNYLNASKLLFERDEVVSRRYADFICRKLGGWTPDVIISFLAPLPDFSRVWPNVTAIYTEFGMFSRVPYPRTFYFDHHGMFGNSALRKFSSELLEGKAGAIALEQLKDFRNNYLYPFYLKRRILGEDLIKKAGGFEFKILLPLQFSNYFGFDCCSSYADQFDYLVAVLDSIPKDIGVFVTEHTGWPEVLTQHNVQYLQERYENLLWSSGLSKIRAASQYLLPEVDAVVTVSSSIGLQCMAWDKPLFSPWDSHLSGFSMVNSLSEISSEKIRGYKPGYYDNAVIELLGRYYLTERHVYDGAEFFEYLQRRIKNRAADKFSEQFPIYHGSTVAVFDELKSSYREADGHKQYIEDLGDEVVNIPLEGVGVPNEFKKIVAECDVVSFDLFDTLIDRPFYAPHELFLNLQKKVRLITGDSSLEFHKLRRYAEHRARQMTSAEEVTVEEIYEVFCSLSGVNVDFIPRLIEAEFEEELEYCRQRNFGRALYDYAKEQGKSIVVTSDFYFGEQYLRRLISRVGYTNVAKVFVSADLRLSKKHGGIYREVLQALPVPSSKILHVGDNLESDVQNANKYGLKSYLTPKAIENLKSQTVASSYWTSLFERVVFPTSETQIGQSVFFGVSARRYFDNISPSSKPGLSGGDPSRLGYFVLGPLVFAFTQWLIEQLRVKNADSVNFLARDGRLFYEAYRLFCRHSRDLPLARYLLSSRRAYGLAAVFDVDDAQELISIPFEPCSVKNIFQTRFGIELNSENCNGDLLQAAGLANLESRVHPVHDLMRLKRLVVLLWPALEKIAIAERSALNTYCDDVGLLSDRHPAVVDIGYAGTLQAYLEKILDKKINGFYFVTHARADAYKRKGLDITAYYRESVEHHLKKDLISKNISLFELLFSSDEQSLLNFEYSSNGEVIPVYKNSINNTSRTRLVKLIQQGAMLFVNDVLGYLGDRWDSVYYSRDFAVHNLELLITQPAREDALLFNNISAEDGFSGKAQRMIIADVVGALNSNKGRLSKEQAISLISASEWKEGARAILPKPASSTTPQPVVTAKPARKSEVRDSATSKFIDRHLRLYRKFRRDPYLYCADSKNPFVKKLKRFFI